MTSLDDFLTLKKQLCFAIYETAGEFNKLYTSILAPFDLTYPQYLVLLALWEHKTLSVKELGEQLHLGTGTLTPMISRMETKGWVKKERSKEDERKVFVHLQDKAYKEKVNITARVAETIESCHIQLEEYEQLMQQLNRLHKKITERTK